MYFKFRGQVDASIECVLHSLNDRADGGMVKMATSQNGDKPENNPEQRPR